MATPNATAEGENTRIKFHPSLAPSCDCDINVVLPWPQRQLNLIRTGALSHRRPKRKRRVGESLIPRKNLSEMGTIITPRSRSRCEARGKCARLICWRDEWRTCSCTLSFEM